MRSSRIWPGSARPRPALARLADRVRLLGGLGAATVLGRARRVLGTALRAPSLLDPRYFVRGPGSSLESVRRKYGEPEEVRYCSQRAFAGLEAEEEALLRRYMVRRGRVLDVGCGAGREAFALAEAGFEVVGIDVSPPMIAEARRHARASGRPVRFEVADCTRLGYPPASFDYVLMSAGVYSLIPTRALRVETLRRLGGLLSPGGLLLFSVLYRGRALLSRVAIYSGLRRLARPILGERLRSEPGDALVGQVSPVGNPSTLCYVHLFSGKSEVAEELALAGLDGFEDRESGFWVARPPAAPGTGGRRGPRDA